MVSPTPRGHRMASEWHTCPAPATTRRLRTRARSRNRPRGSAVSPVFAPDGRHIAFVGHEHGDEGSAKNIHLMVVAAQGGEPRSVSTPIDRPVAGWPPTGGRALAWGGGATPLF